MNLSDGQRVLLLETLRGRASDLDGVHDLAGKRDRLVELADQIEEATGVGFTQRARWPDGALFTVGAYVVFEVWAQAAVDADHIVRRLGIPNSINGGRTGGDPLRMEGAVAGSRVTADAVTVDVLAVYPKPEVGL